MGAWTSFGRRTPGTLETVGLTGPFQVERRAKPAMTKPLAAIRVRRSPRRKRTEEVYPLGGGRKPRRGFLLTFFGGGIVLALLRSGFLGLFFPHSCHPNAGGGERWAGRHKDLTFMGFDSPPLDEIAVGAGG